MALKDIVNKVKKELEVVQGEETKDTHFAQRQTYPSREDAEQAYRQSREKLFRVNHWSDLPGINSTFRLYTAAGEPSAAEKPQVGDYIQIILPGIKIENWVQVTDLREEAEFAEFTVHPSQKPQPEKEQPAEVKHFFTKEASSTFRVELQGNTLIAQEVGQHEAINNQGEEAGNRSLLNTIVAETGWAAFQRLQWEKLTSYLVHKTEAAAS
jgi:hypothetical protein